MTIYIVSEYDPVDNRTTDAAFHQRVETAHQKAKELMEQRLEILEKTNREYESFFWSLDTNPQALRAVDKDGNTLFAFLIFPMEVEP